ncbi:peptidoglycan-binding domain-containing protein [Thiolapillus sp.]|uniref:peptidoglycan-binding domain-containing protein n=1 Tax=Thiolapillus sp. TaxID=2017437 RepID=UPI003AF59584
MVRGPCPDNPLAIIQTMLRLLGYDIEGATGRLDSKTLAAIESYQRKHNIPPGKLSRQALLEHIFQYVRSNNFILTEKQ